ncbi:MAG: D-Ala-D-Ala carboxypeptidase family metallohydrolase [Candidatus Aenigmatarchaeota archaeon]
MAFKHLLLFEFVLSYNNFMDWSKVKYFRPEEFACKCSIHKNIPVYDMDESLVLTLDRFRSMLGVPILITSGYRCPEHNAAIGGAFNSFHTKKQAVDFTLSQTARTKLLTKLPEFYKFQANGIERYIWALCEQCGFNGLGYYPAQNFFHVDMGNRFERWKKGADGKYIYIFGNSGE